MSTNLCVQILQWMQCASELRSTYIVVSVINGLCSFVAVVGNVFMILGIQGNSSLRRKPSFMLLCNLAISDLGVGLISQPLFIALGVAKIKGVAKLSCKISIAYSFTTRCLALLSVLTFTTISFDRFLAVHLKLKYRSIVTVKRMKMVISLLWLVAMVSGMTYLLHYSTFFVLSIIVTGLCVVLTTFNYLAIARKLYGHNARLQEHNRDVDGTKRRKSFNVGQYKKTLKNILYVYGVFLVCYLPYLGFTITLESIGCTRIVHAMYLITITLVLANSSINPCLYYWRISELREAVQKLLGLSRLVRREATYASTSESML